MNEIFNDAIEILLNSEFIKKDKEKLLKLIKMSKQLENPSFEDILLRSAIIIPKSKNNSISWLSFMFQHGLRSKSDLWQKYESQSAFVTAIRDGGLPMVKLFLENGLKLEKDSPVIAVIGASSLDFKEKVKLFDFFCEAIPNIDIDIPTNMFNEKSYYNGFGQAYSRKDLDFATFLIEKGVSIKGSYTVNNDGDIENFLEEYSLDKKMKNFLLLEEKYQLVKGIVVKNNNTKRKI